LHSTPEGKNIDGYAHGNNMNDGWLPISLPLSSVNYGEARKKRVKHEAVVIIKTFPYLFLISTFSHLHHPNPYPTSSDSLAGVSTK